MKLPNLKQLVLDEVVKQGHEFRPALSKTWLRLEHFDAESDHAEVLFVEGEIDDIDSCLIGGVRILVKVFPGAEFTVFAPEVAVAAHRCYRAEEKDIASGEALTYATQPF